MKSSLPFIPRATTQRPQSGLKTFLEAHSILEQVDRSPSSWSQELVSPCWQRLLEHPCPAGWPGPLGLRGGTDPDPSPPAQYLRALGSLHSRLFLWKTGLTPAVCPLGQWQRIPLGPESPVSWPEAPQRPAVPSLSLQESFLPSVALVLNRGRPKGSCLL